MNKTKNNHYVPKFYLKKFLDINNQIWKLDKINNKIYSINNLASECSKKNLYTVKQKITQSDIDFIIKIFKLENQEIFIKTINHLAIFLNDKIGNLFSMEYLKDKQIEKLLNDSLNKSLNNLELSRTQEILITELYENKFIDVYEQILNTNSIDFLEQKIDSSISLYACVNLTKLTYIYLYRKLKETAKSDTPAAFKPIKLEQNKYFDFILYFLLQNLRTERFLSEIQISMSRLKLNQYANINNTNFAFLCMNISLILLSKNLFYKNTCFKFVLIKNISNNNFITSDCPCSNIYASFVKGRLLFDHEIEFIYPLSPKLAILMTDKECYKSNSITIDRDTDIDIYNKTVLKNAKRYIYANSKNTLEKYLNI